MFTEHLPVPALPGPWAAPGTPGSQPWERCSWARVPEALEGAARRAGLPLWHELHTCPSRSLCCPLPRYPHTSSVPREQSDTKKGAHLGPWTPVIPPHLWQQGLPPRDRGTLVQSTVCDEVIVWAELPKNMGGVGRRAGGGGPRAETLQRWWMGSWVPYTVLSTVTNAQFP